jgi:hypothetical protein
LKISNRIFFFDRTVLIDRIANPIRLGEKTGTRKLKLETKNPDAGLNPDADTDRNWRVLSKNQKIFIKKKFFFIVSR